MWPLLGRAGRGEGGRSKGGGWRATGGALGGCGFGWLYIASDGNLTLAGESRAALTVAA